MNGILGGLYLGHTVVQSWFVHHTEEKDLSSFGKNGLLNRSLHVLNVAILSGQTVAVGTFALRLLQTIPLFAVASLPMAFIGGAIVIGTSVYFVKRYFQNENEFFEGIREKTSTRSLNQSIFLVQGVTSVALALFGAFPALFALSATCQLFSCIYLQPKNEIIYGVGKTVLKCDLRITYLFKMNREQLHQKASLEECSVCLVPDETIENRKIYTICDHSDHAIHKNCFEGIILAKLKVLLDNGNVVADDRFEFDPDHLPKQPGCETHSSNDGLIVELKTNRGWKRLTLHEVSST